MSYDDEKNRQIQVAVGINAAATLAAKTDNPIGNFIACAGEVVTTTLEIYAEHAIKDALPGTQDVTSTPAALAPVIPLVPAPQQAYVPPPVSQTAPATVPGATDGDPATAALWQEFFADPTKFWDNRKDKRNPRAPDFKSKSNGDKALWIVGKANPSWVLPALQQRGLAA